MRRKLSQAIIVLGALSGLLAVGPAAQAAASAAPVSGPFALTPVPGANGQPRPYFTLAVAPGRAVRDSVVISNLGSTVITLRVGTSDGTTAAYSGSAYGPLASPCAGIGCWITGLPRFVTVEPHSRQAVRFQVSVPAGAAARQYLAGISATPATAPKPIRLRSTGRTGTQVVIVQRVSVGVAVTVGKLARLRTRIDITGASASWIGALVRLGVHLRNDGQRFTKGTGRLSCALGATARTYPVNMDTVLPGDEAALQVNGIGMHAGTWLCTVRIKDSGGHGDAWAGAVTVPGAVPVATRQIAANDFVVPSSPGMPAWAIGLFVMAGLILFSLWAVLLRRGRQRHGANSPGA